MFRSLTIFVFLFLFCVTIQAQSVTVTSEARLYVEPDERGDVRATLPAGVQLTVVAEQGGWLAVSTQTGIAGWVLRSLVSPIDASEAEVVPVETPAPPPPVETEADPPPPPPVVEEEVSPAEDVPAPQEEPPRAEQRQPVRRLESAPVNRGAGGFYNLKKWWGISVGSRDDTILAGGSYGMMIRRMVGINILGLLGYTDTFGTKIYSGGGGATVDVFVLQPNDNLPVGAYVGGRGTYEQMLNDDFDSLGGIMSLGGEAGAYAHFGDKVLLIPRAGVRFVQNTIFVDGNKLGDDTQTLFVAGLDVRFGSIVPGFHVTIFDGGEILTGSLVVGM